MDHLINPEVVKQFEWDAQKVYRYDGENSTRIFAEPWTGKQFWDIQVRTSKRLHFNFNYMLINYPVVVAGRCKDTLP